MSGLAPVFGMGLMGLLFGWLATQSWQAAAGLLVAIPLAARAFREPLISWKFLFLEFMVLSNFLPKALTIPLYWGVLMIFFLSAWSSISARKEKIYLGSVSMWQCIAAWLVIAFLSAVTAIDPFTSMKSVVRYVLSFSILLTYLNWIRSEQQVRSMINWWEFASVLIGCFLVGEALYNLFAGGSLTVINRFPPKSGDLGIIYAALLPVLTALVMADEGRTTGRVIGMLVLFVAVCVSGSRAAFGATIIGMAMVCGLRWPPLSPWMLFGLLLLIGFGSLQLWMTHGSLSEGFVYQLSGRNMLWRAAVQAARDNPWLGIGPGCWAIWLPQQFMSVDFILRDMQGNWTVLPPDKLGGEAHSVLLTKAAEMGIVSLVFLIGMFTVWFRAIGRMLKEIGNGWSAWLVRGCFSSVCGLIFLSLLENGPIIGRARGGEIFVVWLVVALPFIVQRRLRIA